MNCQWTNESVDYQWGYQLQDSSGTYTYEVSGEEMARRIVERVRQRGGDDLKAELVRSEIKWEVVEC